MMTSHNWPEYQLPKTICGDILHHNVKVLSEILHYAVPDHSLWLLQYYGSLACISEIRFQSRALSSAVQLMLGKADLLQGLGAAKSLFFLAIGIVLIAGAGLSLC